MKPRTITKANDGHEVECPHCGETQVTNDGTGNYECPDCGGDIEITLACPRCGEELEVAEWGETECPECGAQFDSWDEAEVTAEDEEEENEEDDHEVECPHCHESCVVNDGTGNYECPDCGGDIEITLACPECAEELEVEEWGDTECPDCVISFDSWDEAQVTGVLECPCCGETCVVNDGTGNYECPDCGGDIEITLACPNPECGVELGVEKWGACRCPQCGATFDSWQKAQVTAEDDAEEDNDDEVVGETSTTNPGLIRQLLDFFGIQRPNSAVNAVIGKYSLVQLLGQGAFGLTYKAVDHITDETVALKVYKNTTASALRELQKEVQNMRHIQHPHLVAYRDSNIIDSIYYVAMEFCGGGSLAGVGKLPKAIAIQYIDQILDGTGYLHNKGVLHRDIKPDNILLDQSNHIKICDFGISINAEHTIVGASAGTPLYMAPEQFSGRTSRRSDIWSIGIVAYELLHGRRPFSSPAEIVHGNNPRVTAKDSRLAAILLQALNRDERQRFQSCSEFKSALDKIR
jgi:hypothetical protein